MAAGKNADLQIVQQAKIVSFKVMLLYASTPSPWQLCDTNTCA